MADNPKVNMRLGLLMRKAHVIVASGVDAALEPLGLLARHFGALLLIGRRGVSTQRELIAETGSDKAGMVRTVDLLASRGYIEQRQSTSDRRVVELRLTDAGRDVVARGTRLVDETLARLFAGLERAEIERFEQFLVRFTGASS